MDSIPVLIRLTGLLLFTPPNGAQGSMNVLMPPESSHVAEVGYWKSNGTGCNHFIKSPSSTRGVCYVLLDGSTLELGTPGNGHVAHVPGGNVSRVSNRRVAPEHLRPTPGNAATLKARVVLHQGMIAESCALGRFSFGTANDSVDLANVVRWEYRIDTPNLVLTRRRFSSGQPYPDITLSPDLTGVIELFIRHIPRVEAGNHPPAPKPMRHGDPARHFAAYYQLLAPSGTAPLPIFGRSLNSFCSWPVSKSRTHLRDNAGTMSCMVAVGDPP